METVGNYLMAFFSQDVFETEGQVYGEQWARLNAKYEEWKATHYPGRGVLEASGKMRYAFQLMTTSTYALIQNPTEYAKFHMTGTSHMPARVFMKIDEQRAEEVVKKIKEGIQQRIGESLL
jgi:phage gpG-like protein